MCDYPQNVKCPEETALKTSELGACTLTNLHRAYPDPKNISKYYECSGEGWVSQTCLPTLQFNSNTSKCDYPKSVDWSLHRSEKRQTFEPCTLSELNKLAADPNNCNRFYQCTLKGWLSLACSQNLNFNAFTSRCEDKKKVDCAGRGLGRDMGSDPCTLDNLGDRVFDPDNCTNYYECRKIGWLHQACKCGMYFNQETSKCDEKENVDGQISSEEEDEEEEDDDDADDELESCPEDHIGEIIPDSTNCSAFYECTEEGWSCSVCPDDLLFNPETLECDDPENVKCFGDASGESAEHSKKSEQCSKFFDGKKVQWVGQACYTIVFFNEHGKGGAQSAEDDESAESKQSVESNESAKGDESAKSDESGKSNESDESNKSEESSKSEESNQSADSSEKEDSNEKTSSESHELQPCEDDQIGELIPDSTDSSTYYECTEEGWVHMECIPGLHFDPVTVQCSPPEDIHSEEAPSEEDFELDPCTPDNFDEVVADPNDLSKYYQCTEDGWEEKTCPADLYFNPSTSECDYPVNINGPDDNGGTYLGLESCTESKISKKIPDPKNCSRFYECTPAGWVGQRCYPNFLYNPDSSKCDYPENVDCQNQQQRLFLEPCTEDILNKLIHDNTNCSRFYECTEAGWIGHGCHPTLFFNPDTNQCDYPENVNCPNQFMKISLKVDESCSSSNYNQLMADPSNCRRFLKCSSVGWMSMPCPQGLFFNPTTLRCDNPENVDC